MFRLQGRISVSRAPKEVSSFLADAANERKWQKDIVHLELLEGRPGSPGAKYERVQVVGGRNIKTVNEVVDAAPGKHVAFKAAGKVIEYRLDYLLKPVGAGTEVELRLEGEMLGFAAMFEGLASEALEKDVPTNLQRLKSTLEKA
jgi:polyketide cyclase/dehydrase/lipid transport protein